MTVEVGIFEAKTHLSELIDQVASGGEDVLITKRGKPVAKLIPIGADSAALIGSLRGKLRIKGDIMSTGIRWNAES